MAICCSHCGVILRGESTHFCSHCGNFAQPHSGVKVPSTPAMGQELLPDFTKEIPSPEGVQQSLLLDAGDDTPNVLGAVIPSLSTSVLSESDNGEDSLSFREEKTPPVSEELDNIDIHKNMHAEFDQSPHDRAEFDQSPHDRSEGRDGEIAVAPIQEDNVEEKQTESEERDSGAIQTVSVPSYQKYIHSLNSTSIGKEVQSVLGGLASKLRSRLSLWLTIFLVALVIVGAVYWLLILQLGPNTDPWQRFNDTNLGFSVLYPTDWQVQTANKAAIVHFYDSTQTDKVDVAVSDAVTSDVAQYLQQQASQLGMTNVTSKSSRSFAGSSWLQVQGKMSREGVSYSVDLLATTHGHHLYLLTQIAPQSTYNDEDALVFSSMRAGLQFL